MVAKHRRRSQQRAHADLPYRCDRPKRVARNRSAVLDAINGFYAAALDRLPLADLPTLGPRLLKAGLCLGFSDPVSNIILNTSSSRKPPVMTTPDSDEVSSKAATAAAAKRRQRRALSRAISGTSKVKYWPPHHSLLRDMPVADRSLEALVAFLTYYFLYLPAREALEYLRLANADLLSAVRLIEEDHNSTGSGRFSFASQTTKTTLKCAAIVAYHPKPRALVNRSYSFASRMDQLSQLLLPTEEGGCLSCTVIDNIHQLLIKPR
ncbi:unnamed protein product [Urochloa humidicola]